MHFNMLGIYYFEKWLPVQLKRAIKYHGKLLRNEKKNSDTHLSMT